MDSLSLLVEMYGRLPHLVSNAVDGLTLEQVLEAPGGTANPIAWLIWHIARVQDFQIADIDSRPQEWESGDWPARFGLEADPRNTGYGHTPDQVHSVRPVDVDVLVDYLNATTRRSEARIRSLHPGDLDRVLDNTYDPPVTVGVRLVSIVDDCLQHVGQAAYIRGLLTT